MTCGNSRNQGAAALIADGTAEILRLFSCGREMWPHGNRQIAHVDMTGWYLEPFFVPVTTRLDVRGKSRRVSAQNIQLRALGLGYVSRYAYRLDGHTLLRLVVKAEGAGAAR